MRPEATPATKPERLSALLRLLQLSLTAWEMEADALAAKHDEAKHLAANIKQVRQSLREALELIERS